MKLLSIFSNCTFNLPATKSGSTLFGLMAMLFCLLSLFPNSMSAADNQAYRSGGFVVIVQGLTDSPIELEFANQKNREGKQSDVINITLRSSNGHFIQELISNSPTVDLTGLSLSSGNYLLSVEVGGMTRTVLIKIPS